MDSTKIAIYNNKGGVAKTTSVINLAYCLSTHGKRVLVVDCDTQENCFSFFLSNRSADAILHTDYDKIDHTTWFRYMQLNHAPVYDYIIFDMPPLLSEEVREIIRQCDTVYVPTILGEFEISGLKKVTDACGTKLGGIFVTMYQPQIDAEIIEEFRRILSSRLMTTVIPFSKTVRESQKAALPIEAYFKERGVPKTKNTWKIVTAYEELTKEIMRGAENG